MDNKKCVMCKRTLPVNQFGLRQTSKDGYNEECKDCNNFKKRRYYRKSLPEDADLLKTPITIYPLRENNRVELSELAERGVTLMQATGISDGQKYVVEITARTELDSYMMKVYKVSELTDFMEWHKQVIGLEFGVKMLSGTLDDLRGVTLNALQEREIRLHRTRELDI